MCLSKRQKGVHLITYTKLVGKLQNLSREMCGKLGREIRSASYTPTVSCCYFFAPCLNTSLGVFVLGLTIMYALDLLGEAKLL